MKKFFILMILFAIYTNLYAEVPDWQTPNGFSESMSVACRVYVNDIPEEDANNLVGAFVGEEVRGVNGGPFYDIEGVYVTLVTVASNTIGEEISFKLYDASNDVILPITETLAFSNDGYGTYLDPEEFHAISEAPADTPAVTTGNAADITTNSATLNGVVNPNNLETTCYFEYGLTTSYGSQSSSQILPQGTEDVDVNAALTNLDPNSTYHYRLVATNSEGTTQGSDQTFTTLMVTDAPTVTTGSATNIGETTATLNGTINPNNLVTTYYFEYGTTTAYGSQTTSQNLTAGSDVIAVDADITGLDLATIYHFRLVATNSEGTTYGEDMIFPTIGSVPVVITGAATEIGENTFTMNGIINPGGLETTYYFGYGEFQTTPQIIPAGTENVAVSIVLPNVMDGATFYYQLVATNATGTTEGEIQTVTTIFDPLHDVNSDGNVDVQDVQEVIEHYGDEY